MMTLDLSTISQLLYPGERSVDFARIVAELETVLSRLRGNAVAITWDCDDLVYFDMPETRILLAWTELDTPGREGCLTVSVGPGPKSALRTIDSEHDVLCSRLVERIQNRFIPLAVIWRQVEGAIGSELIDDLIETLPDMSMVVAQAGNVTGSAARADKSARRRNFMRAQPAARAPARPAAPPTQPTAEAAMADPAPAEPFVPQARGPVTATRPKSHKAAVAEAPAEPLPEAQAATEPANDTPDLPRQRSIELARLRTALYPADKARARAAAAPAAHAAPAPASAPAAAAAFAPLAPATAEVLDDKAQVYSTQMRLAAHCFNATLILVYAPLGAAVMTYSILKGEDMRLSARMMALAGTVFAVMHSPLGASVASMAGIA